MSKHFAVLVAVAVASGSASADDTDKVLLQLTATLVAKSKTVKVGEVPVFVLTVQNNSTSSVRLLDAGQKDLQFARYFLQVRQDGKPVDLPSAIPGVPLTDAKSYVTLKPRTKLEFEFSKFALRVDTLSPGKYEASIFFSVESADETKRSIVDSSFAKFTVEK